MHVVYTQRSSGYDDRAVEYRNPRYFERIEAGTDKVTIDGHWPEVEAACKAAGVPVVGKKDDRHKDDSGDQDQPDEKDAILAELEARGIQKDRRSSLSTLRRILQESDDGD